MLRLSGLLWLVTASASAWAKDLPYLEPKRDVVLYDRQAVMFSAEMLDALVAIARNFHDDPGVTNRLRAMAICLVWQQQPRHRDSLIVNHQLSRGLTPQVGGRYRDREVVTTILQGTRRALETNPTAGAVVALLQDVEKLWMGEASGPVASGSDRWKGVVIPASLRVANDRVRLALFHTNGRVMALEATGAVAMDSPFRLTMNGTVSPVFNAPEAVLPKRLDEALPYLGERIQVDLKGPFFDAEEASVDHETLALSTLLAFQLAEGPAWEKDWLWIGGELADDPDKLRGTPETLRMLEMFRDDRASRRATRVIVVPSLPIAAFRDWMVFDRLDLFLESQLVAMNSWQDLVGVAARARDEASTLAEALRGFPRLRLAIGSHSGKSLRTRVAESPEAVALLRHLVREVPEHLSARVLLKAISLPKSAQASFRGSLRELRQVALPFLGLRSSECTTKFVRQHVDPALKRLQTLPFQLDSRLKPLADDLNRLLANDLVAYSKRSNKGTSTSRRQFTGFQAKVRSWREQYHRFYDQVEDSSKP